MTATARGRFPPSIKFLAWNEAAERFSYYGMTSILVLHMVRNLGFPENQAVAAYQIFTAGVYFTPLLGALLADRLWGRYRTILWLSFGYVAGHGVLAIWESPWGLLVGLSLIEPGVDLLLEAGMERLRAKSLEQTDYLIALWRGRSVEEAGV